jgi:gliding motility-associated transport system ATP-binding protein
MNNGTVPAGFIITAERLTKYYGPFVAVHDVSFHIPRGQIVALVGPNGAGKTTIMRMLTGYLAPSDGTATIAGFDVHRDRVAVSAAVGYLPENGPLYLDMTPIEALRFFGEARGLPRAQLGDRIDAVADRCDIRPVLDKPIGKLSKGLRQRVGLAQALLHDPPVLIMDEPTAGLDPVQIRHFRLHVQELRRRQTLLISTHILREVEAMADRVLVMHDGRLVFDGTADELSGPGSLEQRFYELTRAEAGSKH